MLNKNIPPWFPKYMYIYGDICVRTHLSDDHHAYYLFLKRKTKEKLYYDGYEYFLYGNPEDGCIPSDPIEFLEKTQGDLYDECVAKYFIDAWNEIIDKYGVIGCQDITYEKGYISHKETYNQNLKWTQWISNNAFNYFYQYINLKCNDRDNVLVLDKIIDEKSAYYWKCSGEYGIRITFDKLLQKENDTVYIENPKNIEFATAYQFIENNPQYKLDTTEHFYKDAINTIKKENPLFKNVIANTAHGYTYIACEFDCKFTNWTFN
ncbi:MAG: hypothetical protein [Wendovervirus sonii]|uniref:Uncharacterized protein n=1 Tax=phage Lak_Megaphage_Sonny TaxID=3109229 RepID=A0ABZ0Z699_9CAUD|nr:MAG: hypothetical protein [phage Lak_Megaphage_Sonny]